MNTDQQITNLINDIISKRFYYPPLKIKKIFDGEDSNKHFNMRCIMSQLKESWINSNQTEHQFRDINLSLLKTYAQCDIDALRSFRDIFYPDYDDSNSRTAIEKLINDITSKRNNFFAMDIERFFEPSNSLTSQLKSNWNDFMSDVNFDIYIKPTLKEYGEQKLDDLVNLRNKFFSESRKTIVINNR